MTFSRALRRLEQLGLRWAEEPIGVTVPFVAFLAVWLPPQMPDMFAGMQAHQTLTRSFLFAFAATLLGLSAWFWTRAALSVRHRRRANDLARIQRKRAAADDSFEAEEITTNRHARPKESEDIAWSEEWAPRLALLFAGGITMLPILFAITSGQFFIGLLSADLMGFGLVGLLFMFVIYRTEFKWMTAFDAPSWMLNARVTRILADAPFGWPFAVFSLLCSGAALLFVGLAPEQVSALDAPTTAIASLAFAIGPLVMALALMRDLAERLIKIARLFVNHQDAGAFWLPGETHHLKRVANTLGTVLLAFWFLSPPWLLNKHVVPLARAQLAEPQDGRACLKVSIDGEAALCRPDLKTALASWVQAQRQASPSATGRLPVVIVAAEGGASRAAVWLLGAMRMLDHDTGGDFGRHVFAISGVSGGSLGAATYARLVRSQGREDGAVDWESADARHALGALATDDLLSGTIATYFLNDMFGSIVGPLWTSSGVPDRNAVLEGTFDKMWGENRGFALPAGVDNGFLGLRQSPQGASRTPNALLPHLLLNGTDVSSGKRMITSTMRWAPPDALFDGAGDFLALAAHDIRLSTAVTNSARFPFVSPAGRFDHTVASATTSYQIIDGGYFENYGARTAWELARAIEDLAAADPTLNVVPVVVVVSNDLEADQAPRKLAGKCRKMLEDADDNGEALTVRCDAPVPAEKCVDTQIASMAGEVKPEERSLVPQSLAPLLGLVATRSAHGRDALNILRRDFCRAPQAAPDGPKTRMIHIALPKPDPARAEAAPMNWVLNPAACDYMLNKAPWLAFNRGQAQRLNETLSAILGKPASAPPAERPIAIECN